MGKIIIPCYDEFVSLLTHKEMNCLKFFMACLIIMDRKRISTKYKGKNLISMSLSEINT